MPAFVLPANSQGRANFDFRVELDGAEYTFKMRFNSRDQTWYFSMFDADGGAIAHGLKVVINADLTLRATLPNAFGGRVYVLDGSRFPKDPGFADLGVERPMVYDDAGPD